MTQPYPNTSREGSFIISMRDWNGFAVADESHVEFEDVQKSWRPEDIAKYLLRLRSREKAIIMAKRMAGIWFQMASMGMTSKTVKDEEGDVLFSVKQGYQNVKEYFLNTACQLYEAVNDTIESRNDMDLLEKKISSARNKDDSEYEEMVMSTIQNCQSVFAGYSLREKIPVLGKLSDKSYNEFCLKFVSCNTSEVVALAYCAGFYDYTDDKIKINNLGKENAVFSSVNDIHKMIVEAKGQSTTNRLKQEYCSIITAGTNPDAGHKAWQYTEYARSFLENLK